MDEGRRQFIRYVVAGPIMAGCPLHAAAPEKRPAVASETFAVCHRVRDGEPFPQATEHRSHDLIIVGGGLSGLTAAYALADRDVLLVEKESLWGGNSQHHTLGEETCSIGAAFVGANDSAGKLARELGVPALPIANWDGTSVGGVFAPDTWGKGIDELPYPRKVIQQFRACRRDLLALDNSGERYSEVSMASILEPYGPEVLQWWNAFCPSNWGGSPQQIAASLGIDELQWWGGDDRTDNRATWVGGIGVLARRLSEVMQKRLGERMVAEATVLSVKQNADRVLVTYWAGDKVVSAEAKAAIIAAPQYITSRLVADLPPDQLKAKQKIRYIPYCVVNLLFDRPVKRWGYDTWCPGQRFADVIVADWVEKDRKSVSSRVLTCYTPLTEDDRESLLSEDWCRKLAADVLVGVQKSLPSLDAEPVEVHLYRRGHAIHTSAVGLGSQQEVARRPFGRISFANTDVESLGSSSSGAIRSGRRAAEEAIRFL